MGLFHWAHSLNSDIRCVACQAPLLLRYLFRHSGFQRQRRKESFTDEKLEIFGLLIGVVRLCCVLFHVLSRAIEQSWCWNHTLGVRAEVRRHHLDLLLSPSTEKSNLLKICPLCQTLSPTSSNGRWSTLRWHRHWSTSNMMTMSPAK